MSAIDFHSVLTVLFFVAFMVMVIWVYLPRRKHKYQEHAWLPFVDEDAPARREDRDHE